MARRKVLDSPVRFVYKVCADSEWRDALECGSYEGSPDDLRDGFVHLSTAAQLSGVLERYFAGKIGLVVVAFPAESLGPQLRWEPSRDDVYPHFYGVVSVSVASAAHPLPDDAAARRRVVSALA